jgi:hypothetical protein
MITIPSARGVITRSPMAEEAVITTKRSSGTFNLKIYCTAPETGSYNYSTIRVTILWWDRTKTTQSYDVGYNPELSGGILTGIPFSFTKSISSPYNNTNDKVLRVFISDANGKALGYKKFAYIDYVNLTDIASLDNGVSNIDVSGLSRLGTLEVTLNYTYLTALNRLPKSLTAIYASVCNLTQVNLNGLTNLQTLFLESNSSLTSIDLSSCINLRVLQIMTCSLSTLNLNGLSNLYLVKCFGNPLTSIRAIGVGGAMGTEYSYSSYSSFYSGINLGSCSLSGSALNQLYTDLNTTAGGNTYLIVNTQAGGGELSDTPSIATNKGYTVLGT